MICVAALEGAALAMGIDGTILAGAIAVIAGLGGYATAAAVYKKKE
jgi:hypothetical protein